MIVLLPERCVSTHSRPKAAGFAVFIKYRHAVFVSTHSRPKAAGQFQPFSVRHVCVSTHSRPKAAGS